MPRGLTIMPNAVAVACRCGALNCEKHSAKANTAVYDRRRGSAASRGYDRNWSQRIRPMVLRRDPVCRDPFGIGCINASTIADHIIPKACGGSDSIEHNLQGVCDGCHNRKIRAEQSVRFVAVCSCKVATHARVVGRTVEFGCASHGHQDAQPAWRWTMSLAA
jgi:5-methylcytosine-specific restriction enzyme A